MITSLAPLPHGAALTADRFADRVHVLAAELRAFAERHPHKRIPHFAELHQSVFLTCRPDDAGLTWELRIAKYNEARPVPHSLAEDAWTHTVQLWREQFNVPAGASVRYDDDLNGTRGYAVIVTWREVRAETQGQLI